MQKLSKEQIKALTTRTGHIESSQINTPQGVAYGKKATIKITPGPTYEETHLRTNLPKEAIEKVEVILNGDSDVIMTGEELVMLENFKKHAGADSAVDGEYTYVIPYADLTGRTIEAQSITSFVTLPGDNIQIKVHIKPKSAEPVADAWPAEGAITLDGVNYTSPGKSVRMYRHQIKTIQSQNLSVGERTFYDLPRDVFIRRIHIKGDISDFELKRDGLTKREESKAQNDFQLSRMGVLGRSPQPGYFHIDFIGSDFSIADLFGTFGIQKELELIMGVETAGTLDLLVESLVPVSVA